MKRIFSIPQPHCIDKKANANSGFWKENKSVESATALNATRNRAYWNVIAKKGGGGALKKKEFS